MNHILVTGATGSVGAPLVGLLRERGAPVRALVRDHARGRALLGPDIELVGGDFADPASVRAALTGTERLFLTCANHPQQTEWERRCIDLAAAAGVAFVVKQSAFGAADDSPAPFLAAHAAVERHLAAAGVAHRVLRPTFKMSNLLAAAPTARQTGRLFLPGGDAAVAMVDPLDVARVAAEALLGEPGAGEPLWLTGPEALTFADVAARLSAAAARPVTYVPVPDDAAREQLVAAGAPPWYADGVVAQFRLLRQGAQTEVSDTVRRVTGRDPRPLAGYLREVAPVLSGAAI